MDRPDRNRQGLRCQVSRKYVTRWGGEEAGNGEAHPISVQLLPVNIFILKIEG